MYMNVDSTKMAIRKIKLNLHNIFVACNLMFSVPYIRDVAEYEYFILNEQIMYSTDNVYKYRYE